MNFQVIINALLWYCHYLNIVAALKKDELPFPLIPFISSRSYDLEVKHLKKDLRVILGKIIYDQCVNFCTKTDVLIDSEYCPNHLKVFILLNDLLFNTIPLPTQYLFLISEFKIGSTIEEQKEGLEVWINAMTKALDDPKLYVYLNKKGEKIWRSNLTTGLIHSTIDLSKLVLMVPDGVTSNKIIKIKFKLFNRGSDETFFDTFINKFPGITIIKTEDIPRLEFLNPFKQLQQNTISAVVFKRRALACLKSEAFIFQYQNSRINDIDKLRDSFSKQKISILNLTISNEIYFQINVNVHMANTEQQQNDNTIRPEVTSPVTTDSIESSKKKAQTPFTLSEPQKKYCEIKAYNDPKHIIKSDGIQWLANLLWGEKNAHDLSSDHTQWLISNAKRNKIKIKHHPTKNEWWIYKMDQKYFIRSKRGRPRKSR